MVNRKWRKRNEFQSFQISRDLEEEYGNVFDQNGVRWNNFIVRAARAFLGPIGLSRRSARAATKPHRRTSGVTNTWTPYWSKAQVWLSSDNFLFCLRGTHHFCLRALIHSKFRFAKMDFWRYSIAVWNAILTVDRKAWKLESLREWKNWFARGWLLPALENCV